MYATIRQVSTTFQSIYLCLLFLLFLLFYYLLYLFLVYLFESILFCFRVEEGGARKGQQIIDIPV